MAEKQNLVHVHNVGFNFGGFKIAWLISHTHKRTCGSKDVNNGRVYGFEYCERGYHVHQMIREAVLGLAKSYIHVPYKAEGENSSECFAIAVLKGRCYSGWSKL